MERPGSVAVTPILTPQAQALVERVGAEGELKRLLEIRIPELIAYQNARYARRYSDFVKKVLGAERVKTPGQTRLSEAVARYLFKLMAYKDEYEVARLYQKPEFAAAVAKQFGANAELTYRLHPPFMRYLGVEKKMNFGEWFDKGFELLTKMKALRGTPLDLFGYASVRRTERALIKEYRTLIEDTLKTLSPATYEQAVQLAELPDMIRGYEDVKMKNVARYREEVNKMKKERVRVRV